MSGNAQRLEFILFLDPNDGCFYSYCPSKGLIAKEKDVPYKITTMAEEQIQQLRSCLDFQETQQRQRQIKIKPKAQLEETKQLTAFQRRPIPLSFLSERKFKYPVYFTEEYLPASALQNFKVNEGGQLLKDNLNDFIKAKIYLGELQLQLERSKKGPPPGEVTIDIKLIASVNEVIRTINRVILQDFGVVITMRNTTNKLIFKVKDKNEYLYGNETIANFQFIRNSLNDRKVVELQILEVSIYDKEQMMKFIFYRDIDEAIKGIYSSFPWEQLIRKNKDEIEFLMWHVPDAHFTHPQISVQVEKLYSTDELVRNNEKIKLKLQQKRRFQSKKIPRFLWKEKCLEFLQKRREQIKNKFIQLEGSIIYSGECFFPFQMKVVSCRNINTLFNKPSYENRLTHNKFLKLQPKQLFSEPVSDQKLPSIVTRYLSFTALRRRDMLDILPYMLNVSIQFVVGNQILHTTQTKFVLADEHQLINHKISWNTISRLPMETSAIFKVQVFEKEGNGVNCGIGVLKLFDDNGYLKQGEQQIHLYAKEKVQLFKIGSIDQHHNSDPQAAKVIVKLPTFKNNVIWTLTDLQCAKMLGYHPQIQESSVKQDPNLQRLNELLRYDPLEIRKYKDKDKQLLRKAKKYYKHQSDKLINYLFAIDWSEPAQVAEAYATIAQWAPLKPTEALFILNPAIADEKIRYFAVKRLQNFMDYEFVLYSNQITQALVSFQTHNNALIDLLIEKCVQQPFSTMTEYFWQFKNRVKQQFTQKRFRLYLECLCMVTSFRKDLAKQVSMNNYLIEMNEDLIKNTESIKDFKEKNKKFTQLLPAVQSQLREKYKEGFYFPIRPQYTFKALKQDQCKMFDSKKLPFSLACIPQEHYQGQPYRIMFKYGDDLKQDSLILQIFRVFDKLWRENGLDLKMNIYRTLSTGREVGFIELVDAQNNSKIHKDFGKGVVEAFDERATLLYLERNNPDKKNLSFAKENYLRSSAAYLVATYILGIGDRHSGNVMVQRNGKFFHIDFGHILGNFKEKMGIKRERSPVLFTSQFLQVMGGRQSSDYSRFQEIAAKAYNILRKNASLIINLLAMMVSAEIPQLKKLQDIEYVTEKLALDLSDAQAAELLANTIKQALLSQQSRKIDNAFHEHNRVD